MGPSLGVCRVRPSPLPAAPPWRGGGAELPRAGAGRAPRRVRAEGWGAGGEAVRAAAALLHSSAPPARGPAGERVPAAGRAAAAIERVELQTPGSSAHSAPRGCAAPCSLVCLV